MPPVGRLWPSDDDDHDIYDDDDDDIYNDDYDFYGVFDDDDDDEKNFDEALTGSSAFSWQPIWGKTFLHEQLKIAAQEIILHRGASSFLTESQVISQLRTISAKKLFMVAVAIEKTNDSDKKEQQAKNCSQSTDL